MVHLFVSVLPAPTPVLAMINSPLQFFHSAARMIKYESDFVGFLIKTFIWFLYKHGVKSKSISMAYKVLRTWPLPIALTSAVQGGYFYVTNDPKI